MLTKDLVTLINTELNISTIKDYCPNGLQVEGKADCSKIVTGVTASQALIEKAIDANADAIIVHHGYFWKGEPEPIVGMKKARISQLLKHDINLLAYHLPLDVHNVLGNNVQLGLKLRLQNICALPQSEPYGIICTGELAMEQSHGDIANMIEQTLSRRIISVGNKTSIKKVAWCTGGGQNFIDQIAMANANGENIDAFISGEISEQTTHSALEQNIDFFAAGHHATERYGVKALGEWLSKEHGLEVSFVDVDNPA